MEEGMRRRILGAVAIAALIAAGGSISAESVQASGVTGARDFAVGPFEAIQSAGSHNVIVTVGGAPSVRAEGDTALLEHLEVRVEGSRLRIGMKPGFTWSGRNGRLTIRVTAPALSAVEVAGSGEVNVAPFQTARFSGEVSGSGNLMLAGVQADRAAFSIAGSGAVRALGTARQGALSIGGSGDADLAGFRVEQADVSIAGSGNARMLATRTAAVSMVGSGNVHVTGGARCSVSKMGSGDITCG